MSNIDAVVFDIGNVLIEWQPEKYYDRVFGRERRDALFAEVDLHAMNELVDLGHNFTETIYATAEANPKWRDEIRAWHDNWIELAQPTISHSVKLLRALRAAGVPVFALSNFGVESFALAQSHYDYLHEFDRFYISGHMKMTKPSASIYEALEADSGVKPGRLLFADDRADNIAAADARGWQTHLFEHPQGWADRLVAEALLDARAAAK